MLHSLLVATSTLALQATADGTRLDYALDVSSEGGLTFVSIELTLIGETDGETGIILPNNWGGQNALWGAIDDLAVVSDDGAAAIRSGDDPSRLTLTHAPGAELTLRYTVTPERTGEPLASLGDYYRPYVEPDWVHLIGQTIFAFPDSDADFTVEIALHAPQGWTLASDLEQDELDISALLTSITVAGDFRVFEETVDGASQRVAIRGDHAFTDDHMARSVSEVLAANAAYWGAAREPYLVTVLPLEAGSDVMSLGGTNLGDAFAFFTTNNADPSILLRILTHEHVHTWIPGRVGGAIEGEDEAAGYWFSEGFTDFLTQRTAVKAGLWTAETALENWNEALMENFNSPVRDAPNDAITSGFWTSSELQRLPYHRGMIFAALVDQTIRDATHGLQDLDDVLAAMHANPPENAAPLAFAEITQAVTGVDVSDLVARHIEAGEPVTLPADTFGACGVTEFVEAPVFDYGMVGERNAEDRFVITEVDPGGPAAPAGFEPGMMVVERLEGAYGDASVDSVLRMEAPDGQIIDLRYRPTNGETRRLPRIAVADADLALNGCSARLAGLPDSPAR
ncbi:hypothetical protein [Maricaulis sp.]|uniref:M61 family metallopeptidase n=1 Tax=Maricaulis sp. TaxID=1486257 RepID=UPI0025B8D740|nr:hypothetical protein [Maricaulis sp.]